MPRRKVNARGREWLSGQLGITYGRLGAHIRAGRIPDLTSYTDAHVAEARRVLAALRAANNNGNGANTSGGGVRRDPAVDNLLQRARVKLLMERTALLRLQTDVRRGLYLDKAAAERRGVGAVLALRNRLAEWPMRVALLANKSERECAAVLRDWVQEAIALYSDLLTRPIASAGADVPAATDDKGDDDDTARGLAGSE